ncbi:nitrogen regulatory PII-like, alpha/beta, partial [Wolffia australiana]
TEVEDLQQERRRVSLHKKKNSSKIVVFKISSRSLKKIPEFGIELEDFLRDFLKVPTGFGEDCSCGGCQCCVAKARSSRGGFLCVELGGDLCAHFSVWVGLLPGSFPHLFVSKVTYRNPVEGIRSIRMDSSSATVPYIVVYVTVPNKDAGKKLSESIIQEKLAACVNRVPGVESLYWWDGKVQTDSEELLIIKTRESLLKDLEQHVKANHEYENPEVIALPIIGGSAEYLGWIKNSTKDD